MSSNGYMDDLHKWLRRVPFIEDMITSGLLSVGQVTLESGFVGGDKTVRMCYRMGEGQAKLHLGDTTLRMGNPQALIVVKADRYIPRKYFVESGTSPEQELLVDNEPVGWSAYNLVIGHDPYESKSAFVLPSVVAAMMYAELVYGGGK